MTTKTRVKSEIRWCPDIGMFALDRPVTSCKHASIFCKTHCFNNKLYKCYKRMSTKDVRNEKYWQQLTGEIFKQDISRKVKQTKRFRFMTRGEALSALEDIDKVKDIVMSNPDITFWLPTRAWRKPIFKERLEKELMSIPNLRLQASLDPSNTVEEREMLEKDGWSTMYFGDNEDTHGRHKCAKTWNKAHGACATCSEGCFAKNQTHVHLKEH